jgi:hypothetical protein
MKKTPNNAQKDNCGELLENASLSVTSPGKMRQVQIKRCMV